MRRAVAVALLGLALSAGRAAGNGRFPGTVDVKFQPGSTEFLLVPSTFGLLLSKDGGASFQWVCEQAIGYSGTYDPDYEITADGRIYATSFEGLRVSSDGGCSWESIADEDVDRTTFVSGIEIGPDGRIWAATSQGGQMNDVYVSSDGQSFESTGLQSPNWWLSLVTTPAADATRVYASGYKPREVDDQGEVVSPAEALLRRQVDGAWQELDTGLFDFRLNTDDCHGLEDPPASCRVNPFVYLLGVSPIDEDLVFARVVSVNPPTGDAVYRSIDGGAKWEKVLDMGDTVSAFLFTADGEKVIVGTARPCIGDPPAAEKGCVRISSEGGAPGSWETPAIEPALQCLGERMDGTFFGCVPHAQPDLRVLVKSTDLNSWDTVLRFRDLAEPASGPLSCPAGTVQAMTCEAGPWRSVACDSLMLDLPICGGDAGTGANDAGTGADDAGGCCRVGDRAGASAGPTVLVLLLLLKRRRRPARL